MTTSVSVHVPVMADEVLRWLAPRPGAVLIDGTLGGGGHARLLAERLEGRGRVIGLDRDPAAVRAAIENLAGLPFIPLQANFCDLPEVLDHLGLDAVDGVLLDLGLSSDQLADAARGFSFQSDGPLDLRFDPAEGEPAWRLLERLSAERLADVIYQYGEERFSRRIAAAVAARRRESPIRTARELAAVVRSAIPGRFRGGPIDPATRTFQALRIAVNHEIDSLETALRRIPDCLKPQGRLVIISFHSLEDRPVKEAFRSDPRLTPLTPRPVRPSPDEVARNPRARSAKLRAAFRT